MKADWSLYPNFTKAEFDCKHSGKNEMQHEFMQMLQELREELNFPLVITSGYRDKTHPIEARKTHSNGEHTTGRCCDVRCLDGSTRFKIIETALNLGFTRIGIANTFLHLGIGGKGLPNYVIWDYQ
jgi:zinc D-Ala-D-Ala carboxypeptidase